MRTPNTNIFIFKEKIFVNIYPITLPQKENINLKDFFDFEEVLKESIYELQNFLHEFPNHINKEIVFTVPVNKGNYHWVEGTIEIKKNQEIIFYIIDPLGGQRSGIDQECYKEFRSIINSNFFAKKLAEDETSICKISITIMDFQNIQRDRYCGGAVRRLRDGRIFNDDPYCWKGIDLKDFEITIKYEDSLVAREADLRLLINSKNYWVHRTGEKLLNRYKNLDNLLLNKDNNTDQIIDLYQKYHKFIEITQNYLVDFQGSQTLNEYLLIENILEKFEELLTGSKESKHDKKEKEKHQWLEFL